MTTLLLHTCCGPCLLGVWEDVENRFEITSLFYNPNIQPEEEYQKRLANFRITAKRKDQKEIELNYNQDEYDKAVLGLENKVPARCLKCYELRLGKTAQEAKKGGFDLFSTTLLISPYQQHDRLKELGENIAAEIGVDFYYVDWRPYFKIGQKIARETGLYRQKYCGCNWSKKETMKP